jgi:hypothetical protein
VFYVRRSEFRSSFFVLRPSFWWFWSTVVAEHLLNDEERIGLDVKAGVAVVEGPLQCGEAAPRAAIDVGGDHDASRCVASSRDVAASSAAWPAADRWCTPAKYRTRWQ